MEQYSEEIGGTVPRVHAAVAGAQARSRTPRWRRVLQTGVGVGVAAGVAVGVGALASAATSGSSGSTPRSSSTPSTHHFQGHRFGGGGFGGPGGGFGGPGLGFGAFGQVLHGEATVKGPNGYETIEVQTGTVTSVKDVSGTTWSLVVTSTDKTALTYTVSSGTSVNGGESGISSVKTGNSVSIVAVVSKGTATVKTLIDTTTLKANGASWAPMRQGPPMGQQAPPSSGSSTS
jgi:hypothetical protein